MVNTNTVPFPGSEKVLHPRVEDLGRYETGDERGQVTVMVHPAKYHDFTTHYEEDFSKRTFLTPSEYTDTFSAREEDLDAVVEFGHQFNLSVIDRNSTMRHVKFTGRLDDIEAAFGVEFRTHLDTRTGVTYRDRVGTFTVPAAIADIVESVTGLNNKTIAHTYLRAAADPRGSNLSNTVAQVYQFPAVKATAGIGFIELGGGVANADIQAAATKMGIAVPSVTFVGVDGATNGYTGNPNSADGEVALDVQVGMGAAIGAPLYVIMGDNTNQGFVNAINAAIAMNPPLCAISISWGSPEDEGYDAQTLAQFETLFAQAAAKGISVLVASGDNGSTDGESSGNHVDWPAAARGATACGGTNLTSSGSAYVSETTWNDLAAGGGAGGGGISTKTPLPPYQAAIGLTLAGKGIPDVSAVAAPSTAYNIFLKGQEYGFGGTSDVAPFWGALVSCLTTALGKPLGDLNSLLYPLYAKNKAIVHDVTTGTNGTFSAGPGYDEVTGIGSPIGTAILSALQGTTTQPPSNPPTNPPTNPPVNPTPPVNVGVSIELGSRNVPTAGSPVAFAELVTGTTTYNSAWNFGDGSPVFASNVTNVDHTFITAGTYNVSVVVTDASGATGTGSMSVSVQPVAQPTPPSAGMWEPTAGEPLTPFMTAVLADPSVLDPSGATGSLLAYVLKYASRFAPGSNDYIIFNYIVQNLSYFEANPGAVAVLFDAPAPGPGDGWGAVLDGEASA